MRTGLKTKSIFEHHHWLPPVLGRYQFGWLEPLVSVLSSNNQLEPDLNFGSGFRTGIGFLFFEELDPKQDSLAPFVCEIRTRTRTETKNLKKKGKKERRLACN
jgi:hypothetical protein